MKKIVIISLTIILSISLLTGCGKKNQNDQEPKQPNDSIQKIQTIGTLKFEIKSLTYEKGLVKLEYYITNESSETITIPKYEITVTDGNKDILYKLTMTHKDNVLEPNDPKLIKKEIKHDLSKATSIIFELVEE